MECPLCHGSLTDETAELCPQCEESLTLPSDPADCGPVGSDVAADEVWESRLAAGTLVADRYRVVRLLGRGAMGAVYHAEDLKLGVPVALKFLAVASGEDRDRLELFLNEVRLARQISHPNVCRVYDVGEVAGRHYLSMEYIDGENLSSLLKRIGRLPKDKALAIGLDLCHGLEAAHERGILHRDLKPANLMIDVDGRARIADFGLASFSRTDADESGALVGTPRYMAPEQIRGQASVASDLYALGVVLYELFAGKRPFSVPQLFCAGTPDPPPALEVKGLDPGVERAILNCLESDPRDRPPSARAIADAIRHGAAPPWRPAVAAGIPNRRHWVLEEKLGEGGFGEAWLALHLKTRARRVFKFCHDAGKLRMFQREITIFRLLKEELGQRDDITSILDWNLDESPYFIEAEYTSGGNLIDWTARQGGITAVPLATRVEIVARVATALAAAHSAGVLHKDVKPANVLVEEGPELRVQLCDFGIGALTRVDRLEAAGITMLGLTESPEEAASSSYAGTRLYIAPELIEGRKATIEADVYALGVMLYQMVVGEFSRVLAPGWQREVDDELLREDIAAAVDGTPANRPSAARLAEGLRSLAERREARAHARRLEAEAELARTALARARRRRKWVALAAGVLLFLAAVLAVAFEQGERAAREALIEQTLDNHQGMARLAAAAVDRNVAAVQRRVEREAGVDDLRRLLARATDSGREIELQAYADGLYEDYKDRHFFSWVVADREAVVRARSPFDPGVVGHSYGYREWFTGEPERSPEEVMAAVPRRRTGLTLAFESTAEGRPVLMSVAAPIRDEDAEILGVIAATVQLDTFNEWLAMAESHSPESVCPTPFILLVHRGQLVRHPCPEAGVPRPPVDEERFHATATVQELLASGVSRTFRDPLRPGRSEFEPDLAVAAALPGHPEWTVVVVQDRGAALRPLTRMTGRLRRLGRLVLALGLAALAVLVAMLWRLGKGRRLDPD